MSKLFEMTDKLEKMTDIVERLRDWSEYDEGKINDARDEAADEIERLREALRELIDDYEYDSITGLGIAKARTALGEGKE
jgi:Na+/phosphate symporter